MTPCVGELLTKNTNEERFWKLGGEGTVNNCYKPIEKFFKNSLADSTKGVIYLFDSLTFDNIFRTDFDSWRAQSFSVFATRNTFFEINHRLSQGLTNRRSFCMKTRLLDDKLDLVDPGLT